MSAAIVAEWSKLRTLANTWWLLAGILTVGPGDTITLQGTFDWSEPNARASWTSTLSPPANHAHLQLPDGLDNVIVTGPA